MLPCLKTSGQAHLHLLLPAKQCFQLTFVGLPPHPPPYPSPAPMLVPVITPAVSILRIHPQWNPRFCCPGNGHNEFYWNDCTKESKKNISSDCSQDVTACFMVVYQITCQQGASERVRTGGDQWAQYWETAGRVRSTTSLPQCCNTSQVWLAA